MSIPAKCSHCGASYNLGDQMLGKKVRCKSCQKPFLVEDPSAAPARPRPAAVRARPSRPSRPAPVEDDEDDLADDELPRGRKGASRPARKSSTGKTVLIVGGIAAALLLVCSGTVVGGLWLTGFFGGGAQEQTPGGPVVFNGNPGNLTPEQQREFQKQAEQALNKAFGPGNAPPGFVLVNPPSSVDEAIQYLGQDDAHKLAAADWLAKQPVDPSRQAQVARALDPVVGQKNGPQAAAARALGTWGDKDSVPALVKALNDCDLKQPIPPESIKTVMATVGKLKDARGADAVARFLTNFFTMKDAEQALAALGPAAEPAVVKYYFHHDGGTREAARRLAQGYGTKDEVILAQAVVSLKDPNKDTRFQTAEWLAQARVNPAMQAQVSAALVDAATTDPDPGMCPRCARALGVWATPADAPAIAALLDGNAPGAQAARGDLIDVLGRLKDERGVPALVKQLNFGDRGRASKALQAVGAPAEKELVKLVNDPNAEQGARDEAARILKVIGSKENVDLVKALANLNASDLGRRRDGARVLAEMKGPDKAKQTEVATALLHAVNDSDPFVRDQAARALVVWATPEQAPDLLRLVDNMQPQVRQSAMMALGKLHEEKAAAPIALHLQAPEDRRAAGDALRALGPAAETEVAKYLRSNNKDVVMDAIKILGDIGTKKSLPILKQVVALTQAKQRDIAVAAALAIQQISTR